MDLSHNRLGGSLPAEWANMSALTIILLRNNLLTGTLPGSWGALRFVTTMELSHNILQGSLPVLWATYNLLFSLVTKLTLLNISNNCLEAPIPQQWTQRFQFFILTIDNCQTRVFLSQNTTASLRVLCRGRWPAHCDSASVSLILVPSPSVLHATPTANFVSAETEHLPSATVTFANSTHSASAQVFTSSTTSQELPQEVLSSSVLQLITKAPIVATSFISVMAGAEMGGSAQALLAVLDSPCSCSVIHDDGSRTNTQSGGAAVALSPLLLFNDDDDVGVIGPFEVALGNVGISALILLLNFVGAALHGIHRQSKAAKCSKFAADAIKQSPQIFTFKGVAFSPSGAVCRFPSLGLKLVTFLVPGMAWAVAQLASSYLHSEVLHQGNDQLVTTTATELAVGVLVVGVFLCALAVFLKHVILDQWIEQQGPNKNKGGGLVFESFDDWNPFSPPIPRQLASIVCSRSGQWGPTDRRRAFGSPVANAYLPSCVRWAWAVSPAVSLMGVALSSARPASFSTAATVCDGLQAAQVIIFCGGAMAFAIMLPHRSILRSLLATFSGLTNTFVVLLGLLCRHRRVNVDVPLQVSAVGAYVSLIGSIALFSLDKFEARVLATTARVDNRDKRRKQTERAQCGNMPVTRSPLWLSQQAALKSLLCIICSTTSNPSAQNMY
ncbi:GP46-like surface antigen, putative [Bodo saltans]|uniref:GP46-like surface antigen, putative n=1 Tax=Bodo saltans TaxID=75058 RepID=A0A0S4JAF7_BODSA|nr:GP46-like surface antigen, putative [Bodo saltans]|eukprot:CUG87322.1 GP46-like surface antigen, putative [Bodo saltans]